MRAVILRRVVNGIVWIISGMVIIVVRTSVIKGGFILEWEILGGGMMIYGATRLIWELIKTWSKSATATCD
jgi:hypothetical protein